MAIFRVNEEHRVNVVNTMIYIADTTLSLNLDYILY